MHKGSKSTKANAVTGLSKTDYIKYARNELDPSKLDCVNRPSHDALNNAMSCVANCREKCIVKHQNCNF